MDKEHESPLTSYWGWGCAVVIAILIFGGACYYFRQGYEGAPGIPANSNENLNTNESAGAPSEFWLLSVLGFNFRHRIGQSSCPQPIGNFTISEQEGAALTPGLKYSFNILNIPRWLSYSETAGEVKPNQQISLSFTCQLDQVKPQMLEAMPTIEFKDAEGKVMQRAEMSVDGEVLR